MHAVSSLALPFFHLGSIGPIQSFGIIVAGGVIIGAEILRWYAEWHGVEDNHIRSVLAWVTICGFLGAHELDMLFYNFDKISEAVVNTPPGWWPLGTTLWPTNWPLPLKIWEGISSYGGFVGGALGFFFYVWWKRLPMRLFADIVVVGLLPAFSIGRIGCTVVSDHVGAAVDPHAWYSFLAMNYPRDFNMETVQTLVRAHPGTGPMTAWNLGLVEFLYLVPVNALVLWLAFRAPTPKQWEDGHKTARRLPTGLLPVFAGLLYAPVRFLLEFLRPNETDPRYLGMTFAQWVSIVAFAAAAYVAMRVLRTGKAAEPVTRTAGEAHRALQTILRGDDVPAKALPKSETKPAAPKPAAEEADADADADDDEPEAEAEAEAEKPAAKVESPKPKPKPKQGKGNKKKRR
jgi:phosphatidylglycerol---prolipoprotein diacylglyceryl transferase